MPLCPACAQMHAWYGERAASLISADRYCDTVAIRSVSLVVEAEIAVSWLWLTIVAVTVHGAAYNWRVRGLRPWQRGG